MGDSFSDCGTSLPSGFIVFISGVSGAGKTTISYELLKKFNEFRIIEETDIIREILRGYNEYIETQYKEKVQFLFEKTEIFDHTKLLNFDEAKKQCELMWKSFEKIIGRQKRRGISSIINGVHIVPEVLNGINGNDNIVFINLYINSEKEIFSRLNNREPNSFMLDYIASIFETNVKLYESTEKLFDDRNFIFNNIDVTCLTIEETINKVVECIKNKISCDG